ncbi:MAG: response regulator [Phycisphaerae bacterium]|nr:response regulator [Phycisphaerae bacterium]
MLSIFQSLSFKLLGGIVVILLIIYALVGGLTIHAIQRISLYYMDSMGRAISQTAAHACIEPFLLNDYPVLETYAKSLVQKNPMVMEIQYRRRDSKVLATATQERLPHANRYQKAVRTYTALIETNDSKTLGSVIVRISSESMSMLFQTYLLRAGLVLTMSLVLLVVIMAFYLRWMVIDPVKKLVRFSESVGAGSFEELLQCDDQDEIGQLKEALNEMATKLRMSYSAIQERNIELTKKEAMKGQFLASMSHEIRTPLTAIVGFADMLGEEDLSNEQKRQVAIIKKASKDLMTLINDILDISKIEAGKLDIEMIDCRLDEVLDNHLELLLGPKAAEKSIDFKIICQDPLPAVIKTDPFRLHQCLINLISNAIKFTDQGHVYLTVSLHKEGSKAFIRFNVEDTGIGISQDRQQAIFESFTQAEGSTTRQYGGTGLGLTITRELVNLMGGNLTVASEPGKGTVFSLILPVGVNIAGQSQWAQKEALNLSTDESRKEETSLFLGKVLVAEDVEGNQVLIKMMLSKFGVEAVIAGDGREAVQKASSQMFDLIFMDMHMPYMDGREATRMLRQNGCMTPIVALTADAMKGDEQKCIEVGCDGYMTKPIDPNELLCVLTEYLPFKQGAACQPVELVASMAHEVEIPGSELSTSKTRSRGSDDSDIREIIDWDRLLERLGDEETIREIISTYVNDIQEHIELLSKAVANGDCVSIASQAHALKGVGRNLGIERLSDMASQMESTGRENDIEAGTLLLNDLKTETEKVMTVLSQSDWIEKAKMA